MKQTISIHKLQGFFAPVPILHKNFAFNLQKIVTQSFIYLLFFILNPLSGVPLIGYSPSTEYGKISTKSTNSSSNTNKYFELAFMGSGVDTFIHSDYKIKTFMNKGFFTAPMIRQIGFLWTKKDAKNLIAPGNACISGDKNTINYHQYQTITGKIFGDYSYSIGDLVDIIHPDRYLKYNDKIVNLVYRVGLGKIVGIHHSTIEVTLLKIWNQVQNNDRIVIAQPFQDFEIETVFPAEQIIKGTVLTKVEQTGIPYLYQTLIINRGLMHGVQFGDVFKIIRYSKNKTKYKVTMLACVLNVQKEFSSLVIITMYSTKLSMGDEAHLIKRMKFH